MCSAGAALKINNGLKGDPAKQGEPTPCDETCRLTRKARMSKHGVQGNVTGFLVGNCTEMLSVVIDRLLKLDVLRCRKDDQIMERGESHLSPRSHSQPRHTRRGHSCGHDRPPATHSTHLNSHLT